MKAADAEKAWFDVAWIDTIRGRSGPCWPMTYEKLLLAIEALCRDIGNPQWSKPERWGVAAPAGLFHPGGGYHHAVGPFTCQEDVLAALHGVLLMKLDPSDPREAWRHHEGLTIDGRRRIRALHGSVRGAAAITDLLRVADMPPEARQLRVSLNPMHRAARTVDHVRFCPPHTRWRTWRLELAYGLDGSRWTVPLTDQREGESLGRAAERARRFLVAWQTRDDAPMLEKAWHATTDRWRVVRDLQGPLTSEMRARRAAGNQLAPCDVEFLSDPLPYEEAEDLALKLLDGAKP